MIEQYLQVALEFVKEIWFQLDSQLGLEETEAFKFIKPYLLQLRDNPMYMGIAFVALVLVPFGLYKVRSISRERERKIDELMEEEDDKPLFKIEDEPLPYRQILGKLDEEESDDELHLDTQRVMGADKNIEPVSSESAESQIDKDLSELEEFDSDPIESDSPHDLAIQELQEDGPLTGIALSTDDPLANYSELNDEEQDRTIQELQNEMESMINKLTEQPESTPETTSAIKEGDIRIDDGATIDEEFSLEEPPKVSEPEPLSLEALDLTDEVEPAIESIEPVIEDIEPEMPPLQSGDHTIDGKPDDSKPDQQSLINRLKYFQENLDTQFHHNEKRELTPAPKTIDFVEEHRLVEQQSFTTKKAPVDNKKYMEVLESFIFLKDQNKHK